MEGEKHNARKIGWKKSFFLLLRLSGIIIFVIVISRVDLKAMWDHMKEVSLWVVMVSALLVISQVLLKGIRWYFLNKGTSNEKGLARSFGEFFESYAIGIVTPGRLGELIKAGYAQGKGGVMGAGVRVLIERGFDFGIFLMIAGSALAWGRLVEINSLWGLLPVAIGFISVGFSLSLMRSPRINNFISRILIRLRLIREPLEFMRRSAGFSWGLLGISIVSNLVYFSSCYIIASDLAMRAGFLYISGGVAIAGLLNTIPMTIMGLGTREVTFIFVFNEFSRPLVMALSGLIFLIWQVGSGLLSLALGELFLIRSGRGRTKEG